MATTTAVEMAKGNGVPPDKFRKALRKAGLKWHGKHEKWTVEVGSREHAEMQQVLSTVTR